MAAVVVIVVVIPMVLIIFCAWFFFTFILDIIFENYLRNHLKSKVVIFQKSARVCVYMCVVVNLL